MRRRRGRYARRMRHPPEEPAGEPGPPGRHAGRPGQAPARGAGRIPPPEAGARLPVPRVPGQDWPSDAAGDAAAVFAPGYAGPRGRHAGTARSAVPGGGAVGKGPVRGYPPAPGQPPPAYPPGPFSAWNRVYPAPGPAGTGPLGAGAGRAPRGRWAADGGRAQAGGPDGYDEPGYAVLAVSDPAADVTSTQAWNAGDGAALMPAEAPADSYGGALEAPTPKAGPHWDEPPDTLRQPSREAGPHWDEPPVTQRQSSRPAGEPAPAAAGRGRPVRHGARPRRRRHRRTVVIAAVTAVLLAAGAGYLALNSGRHPSSASPPARPSASTAPATPSASPSPPPGQWGYIATRAADPVPLTVSQLFPASFGASGATYARVASRASRHCTAAVLGSRLKTAVSKAGCTQVLRASYVSAARKVMGTIGVLNLVSAAAAKHAGKAAGASEFIAQLRAARGPARKLTRGTGIEEAAAKGHYLILIWAEFTDLKAPHTKSQRRRLAAFEALLFQRTANVSLTRRMVTGQP